MINTWHSQGDLHHNQIDYILTQKIFSTSDNKNKTISFTGAVIGSDHDLVIMKFNLRLKSPKKNKCIRLMFKTMFKRQINDKLSELKLSELTSTEEIVGLEQLNLVFTSSLIYNLGNYRPQKTKLDHK